MSITFRFYFLSFSRLSFLTIISSTLSIPYKIFLTSPRSNLGVKVIKCPSVFHLFFSIAVQFRRPHMLRPTRSTFALLALHIFGVLRRKKKKNDEHNYKVSSFRDSIFLLTLYIMKFKQKRFFLNS